MVYALPRGSDIVKMLKFGMICNLIYELMTIRGYEENAFLPDAPHVDLPKLKADYERDNREYKLDDADAHLKLDVYEAVHDRFMKSIYDRQVAVWLMGMLSRIIFRTIMKIKLYPSRYGYTEADMDRLDEVGPAVDFGFDYRSIRVDNTKGIEVLIEAQFRAETIPMRAEAIVISKVHNTDYKNEMSAFFGTELFGRVKEYDPGAAELTKRFGEVLRSGLRGDKKTYEGIKRTFT